jgi:ATP-dependent DNA ligase
VLELLPKGHVFDGELVVPDAAGRPLFNELMVGLRQPTYVAFDLLIADGENMRPLLLSQRKSALTRIGEDSTICSAFDTAKPPNAVAPASSAMSRRS